MEVLETLPKPDEVAQRIVESRRERALLKRLYRLVLDASRVSPPNFVDPELNVDRHKSKGGDK